MGRELSRAIRVSVLASHVVYVTSVENCLLIESLYHTMLSMLRFVVRLNMAAFGMCSDISSPKARRERVATVLSFSQSVNPLRSQWSEHKTSTKLLHPGRSWASHRSSFQFFPAPSTSASIDSLKVPCGLSLPLFPGGAHVSAAYGWRSFFMRSTCPSHFQRLFFTSWAMSSMPARFQTSLLVTFCCVG